MKILLVDDDKAIRRGIAAFLKEEGQDVIEAGNGKEAWRILGEGPFDIVISDVKMPDMDGLSLLKTARERGITVPFIMMTAFATVEEAVHAMQHGADDYLTKPLNLNELMVRIHKVDRQIRIIRENQQLKDRLEQLEFPAMIGTSHAMQEIQHSISQISNDPDVSVMIYGESGTGKELVARTIHMKSRRSQYPFIAVNCAVFSDELLASELFGHKKGAFTGAYSDKEGFFAMAHRGSLFLDEVSEMSPGMQSKLLRVLQEQVFYPVGGTTPMPADVRILGASNRNLEKMVKGGTFRNDLYYRLNVLDIHVAPLRERREDIPLLIMHFLEKLDANHSRLLKISQEVYRQFDGYQWPGNVRELENLMRRLWVTCDKDVVEVKDLPDKMVAPRSREFQSSDWQEQDYKTALSAAVAQFEKSYLLLHLQKHGGNIARTARSIGLSRVALHQKIKNYGIVKFD